MQYVGRAIGSVSKTWNSINPATLSGSIDVIVVEQKDGELCCSPFHVRFGKFSLLRPSEKKVEFIVNGVKTDLPMKLGEGGEAFFVFETEGDVPDEMLTSPVVSPASSAPGSPEMSPRTPTQVSPRSSAQSLQEPEFLDINDTQSALASRTQSRASSPDRWKERGLPSVLTGAHESFGGSKKLGDGPSWGPDEEERAASVEPAQLADPPKLRQRADTLQSLAKKLGDIKIPSTITDNGDLILDMGGYKPAKDQEAATDEIVRQILAEELSVSELDSVVGRGEDGKYRVYSDLAEQMAAEAAVRSAPGSPGGRKLGHAPTMPELDEVPSAEPDAGGPGANDTNGGGGARYVKTLRLTSAQLKGLGLKPGGNDVTFRVNQSKATIKGRIFYWRYSDPVVISDIDGTITKSDALGHVFAMIGRDWTHEGVGKLFSDIANNGYNIMYLTARSVGLADSTRAYLKSIVQEEYRLPDGPVILSPDRTMAALRREVILKKPEVFKMSCLRDIQSLYKDRATTPFYAGFGNRITDALSYRSVGVPSSKIFTINTSSEVHMELLELAGIKSSYLLITELVDHFFPAVTELSSWQDGAGDFSDLNFWRDPALQGEYEFSSDESDDNTPRPGAASAPATPKAGMRKTMTQSSLSTLDTEASDSYDDDDDSDDDDDDDVDEDNDNDNDQDLDHDLSASADLSQSMYESSQEHPDHSVDADTDPDVDEEFDLDHDLLDSPTQPAPRSRDTPADAGIVSAADALRDMKLK